MKRILAWFACLVLSLGSTQVKAETSKGTVKKKSALLRSKVETLTLTEGSLGPLKLTVGDKVTVEGLRETFPGYKVEASVGQTDGPDMYIVEVKDRNGPLFVITSAIEEISKHDKNVKADEPISLDVLTVKSPKIMDQNGLKVGDSVAQLIKKHDNPQQEDLHHSVGLQVGKLCYEVGESEGEPQALTPQEMIKANWKIHSISWPRCNW